MSEIVVGALIEKAVEHALSRAIERLSRLRAKRFFSALVAGLSSGKLTQDEAAEELKKALSNETKSEVIFESYRRVCLSASRTIGPTFIGLLTAKLLSEGRNAKEPEERMLMAAEELSDLDLGCLYDLMTKATGDHDPKQKHGMVVVDEHREEVNSAFGGGKHVGPLDLAADLGVWAQKCSNLGIVRQTMTTEHRVYNEEASRYGGSTGAVVTNYTWKIGIAADVLPLLPLLESALSAHRSDAPEPDT